MDDSSRPKGAKDYFETPEQAAEQKRLMALPFRMTIEDVFNVKGRGVVVVGRIETGLLEVGDAVFIMGGDIPVPSTVSSIEMFGGTEMVWAGDNVAILLRSVERHYIKRGMILIRADETR